MLRYLKIQNLAVIGETQLELDKGFICLTGESGAGKSVLVDAFLLLAGGRASADLVRTGCDKAIVEAEFELSTKPDGLDLMEDETLYLRREISKEGKSRAFVNGALVANSMLQKYAEPAFEIHGQHGQQRLLKEKNHLTIFDLQAGLSDGVQLLGERIAKFRRDFQAYWEMKDSEHLRRKEADFIRHQLAEIEKVNPGETDLDLDIRLKKARNQDTIRNHANDLYTLVDRQLSRDLNQLIRHLQALMEFQPELDPYVEQVKGLAATLSDLQADVVSGVPHEGEHDLNKLEARESDLNRLFMKYGRDIHEVLAERERLQKTLEELTHATDHLDEHWANLECTYLQLRNGILKLQKAREKASTDFEKLVKQGLSELSLARADFQVERIWQTWPETLPDSRDVSLAAPSLRFLFSANLGEPPRALAKVASGGELSRLLLALIEAAQRSSDRLLVFDEIDAGLGGETAHAVGAKLAKLGKNHQVLCVTHFAQVARFANTQIKVEKTLRDDRTETRLVVCDYEERVAELARLMGGDAQAENLRDHARQLMMETPS